MDYLRNYNYLDGDFHYSPLFFTHNMNINNEQIKKNLLAKEKIEMDADSPQKMRDARPATLASLFQIYGGGCINEGSYISYPIMEFYNFDAIKFLCFVCQQQEKIEHFKKQNTNPERLPDEEEYENSNKALYEDYYLSTDSY